MHSRHGHVRLFCYIYFTRRDRDSSIPSIKCLVSLMIISGSRGRKLRSWRDRVTELSYDHKHKDGQPRPGAIQSILSGEDFDQMRHVVIFTRNTKHLFK